LNTATAAMSAAAAIVGVRRGTARGKEQAEIARQQRASLSRLEARQQAKRNKEIIKGVMGKYDKDGNKGLDRDELGSMLADYSTEVFHRAEVITEDDLDFLLALVDQQGGNGNGLVQGSEIIAVCDTWFAWLERGPDIDTFVSRFDADTDGRMDRAELQRFLLDLNKDDPVPVEVLDFVMNQADFTKTGSLCRLEVARAVAIWYMWSGNDVTGQAAERSTLTGYIDKTKLEDLPPPQRSSCCTVS